MNKQKPWKPSSYIACPECEEFLFISSVISENGQVNFACSNEDCSSSGFVFRGEMFFNEE